AADPELERIKREMEIREEREKRLQGAMEKGDIGAFLREPLEIPLKCRSCLNVYHYTVGKVFVAVGGKDTVIEDHIVCKKCGALDHYEVANAGMVAVTARLALLTLDPETAKMDRDEMTVVPMRSISAFGKEIPLQDLLDKYEKKLRKNPESPELLIGFANALRQIKRREDSVPFYERAIGNDPLAVEGYVSLGEYAFDKGDLETAFSHYSKAAEIMDRGRYYRVSADLDQFKEGLLDKLMLVAERLGRGLPHPGAPRPGGKAAVPARQEVGRNHPCPCGSGKKYKKCCLLKESGQGAEPAEPGPRKPPVPDPVFQSLQKSLSRYVEREIFRKDFLRATGIFWNIETREPIMLPERASEDKGQFHDWFIHDYRTGNGKTIIEGFCDRRLNTLSAEEKRLAESLLKSYSSIYEVQDVREGEGLTIRDVFTGETMAVQEVSGSY
ncbi:MAG: SEC-C metal-binding domain-containing protein, partial [Thermodesulfobacteriota bacterium]